MTARLSSIRAALRQRREHRAFRIEPPQWTDEQTRMLTRAVEQLRATAVVVPPPETSKPPDAEPGLGDKTLVVTATTLWRALRKLDSLGSDLPPAARHARNYLRRTRTTLADAGLTVHDHDGMPFDPGLILEVLAREDDEAATEEKVSETVRPTIYLHDRRIQTGQVVVVGPPFAKQGEGKSGA